MASTTVPSVELLSTIQTSKDIPLMVLKMEAKQSSNRPFVLKLTTMIEIYN